MTEAKPHLRVVPAASSDAAGTPVDEDPASEVAAAAWEDLVPRLLLLAMSRLSRMTFRGQRCAVPPGAAEAEDFVNDAVAKTLSGVRIWHPESCTLFQHLAGIVVSDISHAATAAENRLTRADDGRSPGGWPPDRADERPNQEAETLWRSEQRRLLHYLNAIDPMIGRMAELMLVKDIDGSADIARDLGVTIDDVANLRKRMKRAIRAFLIADQDSTP